ncbi:MAG: hypothetical protein Aurels2KO_29210 [Aureliella sp.]
MNTPAHVVASLFVWREHPKWTLASGLLVGAILPDAPMFVFFAVVKGMGYSGEEIWGRLYFLESWQLFFDCFNSFPIYLLIFGIAYWLRTKWQSSLWWMLMAGSAMLHLACDLPLHHDDSHRHFLPFTNYRFASPVSYWDPKHFGTPVAIIEASLTVVGSIYLFRSSKGKLVRTTVALTIALYVAVLIGIAVWLLTR